MNVLLFQNNSPGLHICESDMSPDEKVGWGTAAMDCCTQAGEGEKLNVVCLNLLVGGPESPDMMIFTV